MDWNFYAETEILEFPDTLQIKAPDPNKIKIDSRKIRQGDWFLPFKGQVTNGHNYIEKALNAGAVGFFYESDQSEMIPQRLLHLGCRVSSSLSFIQAVAKKWRKIFSNLKLIAITGSSGKTTAKELLSLALQVHGKTSFSKGNFNNELGLPLSLLELDSTTKFAVSEMGARHPGDIGKLVQIASPNVSCLLNVGTAHLGEFGSIENLLQTKMEIINRADPETMFVYPAEDSRIFSELHHKDRRLISFGFNEDATIKVVSEKWLPNVQKNRIVFNVDGKEYSEDFSYPHGKLAINLSTVLGVCHALGLPILPSIRAVKDFAGSPGRFHKVNGPGRSTIIDDSYNANPESVRAGLESMAKFFSSSSKIVLVLGDMLELGPTSPVKHRDIGLVCSELFPKSTLICIGPDSINIADGAKNGGIAVKNIHHFHRVEDFLHDIPALSFAEVIYIKGSRSIGLDAIVSALKEP